MDAFAARTAAVGEVSDLPYELDEVVRGGRADSDAAAAYDEVRTMGRLASDPKPRLALFETMRWETGELRRWPRHRARMAASAAALGLPFDPSAAATALADGIASTRSDRADGDPPWLLRVRLELREDGTLRVDARPHDDDAGAGEPLPVVVWSAVPIVADDPARRHKTLDRALYDAAGAWAGGASVADVLFLNERGRVAEGAISNVFVRGADGRWRTPPVADGALPGVLRAELIESGEAIEAQLGPEDVLAGTVAIGNALRGLRRVRVETAITWRHRAVPAPGSAPVAGGRP